MEVGRRGMCRSARCRILILQSGQFNVIPWGGGGDTHQLHSIYTWTGQRNSGFWVTGLLWDVFKDLKQYNGSKLASWLSSKGGQCICICICISVLRQLVEQVWAVVDALAGGGALLGGPQPANALPLIDLSLPHYHLHHLSHSHQHTFHMSDATSLSL